MILSVKTLRGQLEVNFESGTMNHSDTSPGYEFYSKRTSKGNFASITLF